MSRFLNRKNFFNEAVCLLVLVCFVACNANFRPSFKQSITDSSLRSRMSRVIDAQLETANEGQAEGLCFSVPDGIELPRSLVNIYQEIADDLHVTPPRSGSLARWAKQGVLLLNATLTVRAHAIGSHQNKGWERFTDRAISELSRQRDHVVFLLWGNYAKQKATLIDSTKHAILTAAHPSPLSAAKGFFGCRHFSQTP